MVMEINSFLISSLEYYPLRNHFRMLYASDNTSIPQAFLQLILHSYTTIKSFWE